jgi:hypothetical protein
MRVLLCLLAVSCVRCLNVDIVVVGIIKLFMNHYVGTRYIPVLRALPPHTSLTVLPRVNPALCYT